MGVFRNASVSVGRRHGVPDGNAGKASIYGIVIHMENTLEERIRSVRQMLERDADLAIFKFNQVCQDCLGRISNDKF